MNYRDWAHRMASGGGHHQPEPQAPRAAPRSGTLPAPPGVPPAGYAWAWQGGTYVLVPLGGQPERQQLVPPPRQPDGVVPYFQAPVSGPRIPGQAGPIVETCALVKPGAADPYSDMLAQLPELVPPVAPGFDAMAGRPSPAARAALAECTDIGVDPNGSMRSFPVGVALDTGSSRLGSRPLAVQADPAQDTDGKGN